MLILVSFWIGGIISFIGSVLFTVSAFRYSIGWGFAVLFLPFAGFLFLVLHFAEVEKAFFIQLAGFGVTVIGFVIGVYILKYDPNGMIANRALTKQPASAIKQVKQRKPKISKSLKKTVSSVSAKVAEPLENVVDRSIHQNFVGMPLKKVEEKLGKPKAIMTINKQTIYRYSDIEFVSDDNKIISGQNYY
jgi:hypothetical protein